jgi:predicted nucleotidyltransferase
MSQKATSQDKGVLPLELYQPALYSRWDSVVAVWLFGSRSVGRETSQSDYDFAIFTKNTTYNNKNYADFLLVLDIINTYSKILNTDAIEVVLLNSTENAFLKFEAISGILIYNKDPEIVASFVSLVAREYESAVAFVDSGLQLYRKHLSSL